jgi:hypothetical protein
LATRIASSTFGPPAVAQLQGGDVLIGLVGDEGCVAVAGLAVEDRELGAGMGPLAANDEPGSLGPGRKIDVLAQLCDLGTVSLLIVTVDRLLPSRLCQCAERPAHPLVHFVADREANACLTAVGGEGVSAPADVGAHEDLSVEVGGG